MAGVYLNKLAFNGSSNILKSVYSHVWIGSQKEYSIIAYYDLFVTTMV